MPVRIGELLLKEKRITPEQLQEALAYQKTNGGKLGLNLVRLGFVRDEDITALLSRQYGVPSINLAQFEIDAARIAEDARFDGLYVLRTNSKLKPLSIALAYRQLWKVEAIFRTAKSILETRPIYHQTDAAIAGHLFCSFLALLLRKEFDERLAASGVMAEWGDVVRDLDRVEQITIDQGTKHFVLRPQAPGCAGSVFKAVGVALPPLLRQLPNAIPPPPTTPVAPPRRRGRPRRGATSR